jgi:hypothetical protein
MKEYICISEYNSIECGYNIENTLKEIIDGNKVVLSGHKSRQILTSMYNKLCEGNYEFPNNELITKSDKKKIKVMFLKSKIEKEYNLEQARRRLQLNVKRDVSLDEIYENVVENGCWEINNIKIYLKITIDTPHKVVYTVIKS